MSATDHPGVTFRPALDADVPACYAVFHASQVELHQRRNVPWTVRPFDPAGPWATVQRHLIAHDGERAFVAEADGRIVAFTEAIQPVSNTLYARRGLLPMTPMLLLIGVPRIDRGANGLTAARPTPEALAAIDRSAYGFDRSIDHELWSRMSSRSTLWLDDGEPCAYSYRGSFASVIGPVAGVDAPSAARALRAELADTPAGDSVRVNVPGTATALVQVALEAGLRFDDPGLLLLSSGATLPSSWAPQSYWLL